jgi:hypothetical protein
MTRTIRCLGRTLATRARSVGVDDRGQIDVRPLALLLVVVSVLLTGWITVLWSL